MRVNVASGGQAAGRATAGRVLRHVLWAALSARWRWVTVGVLVICAITARLGVWQLDRLALRHAMSAQLASRAAAPPLTLGGRGGEAGVLEALAAGHRDLEFRRVAARGTFDYAGEVALTNQVWHGELGVHLITPLRLTGSDAGGGRAMLVDRGWIPLAEVNPAAWARYRAGDAEVEVQGWLRLGQRGSRFDAPPGPDRLVGAIDVARVQAQVAAPLLPFYLVQASDASQDSSQAGPPYRKAPVTDLGDGVHVIVAVQWFAFSAIGLVGYGVYLRQHA